MADATACRNQAIWVIDGLGNPETFFATGSPSVKAPTSARHRANTSREVTEGSPGRVKCSRSSAPSRAARFCRRRSMA